MEVVRLTHQCGPRSKFPTMSLLTPNSVQSSESRTVSTILELCQHLSPYMVISLKTTLFFNMYHLSIAIQLDIDTEPACL